MPYLRYFFRPSIFSCFIVAISAIATNAHAADWPACEKAKLRELKLQRGFAENKISKSKKRNQESRSERIEEIDTWLWKNCREYSYGLRQLEQDRM